MLWIITCGICTANEQYGLPIILHIKIHYPSQFSKLFYHLQRVVVVFVAKYPTSTDTFKFS